MAEVKTDSLTKIFKSHGDEVHAVNSLDINIHNGEFVVFVGPSGSGKTTFLRLVAGLEPATRGHIYIGERDVTNVHPRDRGVAMVFQDYALYPHMSVRQNLGFALRNLKYPRQEIEARVEQVAKMLEIGMLLDRKPRELSGGQCQRVAVGRAVVRRPRVYLFDEPLSNLDAKLRAQMRVELAELHQRLRTTTIYVTHDQIEAMTLGERIVVLNDGVVQQKGTSGELYSEPRNVFVAEFIGSPQMNMVNGVLIRSGAGQVLFQVGDRQLEIPPEFVVSYGSHLGERVILGLRPEHIDASVGTGRGGTATKATVRPRVVEMLGEHLLAHFEFGDALLTAKLDPDTNCRRGDDIELAFRMDKMHLFDAKKGEVIPRRPAKAKASTKRSPAVRGR
ncbi:MAG: ABC transporter ATP-binding protein [bacterium]